MVGLPDASVRESRDRVRAAIRNSGFEFPSHRITVNLAPADVRKAGAAFDLPIAVAILAASGLAPRRDPARIAIVGELSLDGAVLPTRGAFTLVAAMNPCPCGYAGQASRPCRCTPMAVTRYHERVSGPLRDRLDLTVELSPVAFDTLTAAAPAEPSADVRRRVEAARPPRSSSAVCRP